MDIFLVIVSSNNFIPTPSRLYPPFDDIRVKGCRLVCTLMNVTALFLRRGTNLMKNEPLTTFTARNVSHNFLTAVTDQRCNHAWFTSQSSIKEELDSDWTVNYSRRQWVVTCSFCTSRNRTKSRNGIKVRYALSDILPSYCFTFIVPMMVLTCNTLELFYLKQLPENNDFHNFRSMGGRVYVHLYFNITLRYSGLRAYSLFFSHAHRQNPWPSLLSSLQAGIFGTSSRESIVTSS